MLTTVQDLGRPGYAHVGISAAGAADALSLRAGNRLLGNADGAAALEMTLLGGTFEFESKVSIALTGGDFEAGIRMWQAVEVRPHEHIRVGHARSGARCYLCVQGGIDVPAVLGSRSTHLASSLGGLAGRPLRKGDMLDLADLRSTHCCSAIASPFRDRGVLRATRGPQSDWFQPDLFFESVWQVEEDSDRTGLRLRGPALDSHAGHMLTEGVPLGAVQVPAGGQPIVLFVDHQTTGGYPKIANVISADFHYLGQLRPRDTVRFELVTMEAALALLRRQEEWLDSLV